MAITGSWTISDFYKAVGAVWIAGGSITVTGSGAGGLTPVEFPVSSALTDISGTITSGGTAQTIAAANAVRNGFSIQNTSAGDLWFNTLATAVAASPSIRIPAGGLYESPVNQRPTGAISLIGATTGQTFSAREW